MQLLVVEEKRRAQTLALANVSWRRSAELVSGVTAAGGGGGWEPSCQMVLLPVDVVLGGAASGCSVGRASSSDDAVNYRRVSEQTRQWLEEQQSG